MTLLGNLDALTTLAGWCKELLRIWHDQTFAFWRYVGALIGPLFGFKIPIELVLFAREPLNVAISLILMAARTHIRRDQDRASGPSLGLNSTKFYTFVIISIICLPSFADSVSHLGIFLNSYTAEFNTTLLMVAAYLSIVFMVLTLNAFIIYICGEYSDLYFINLSRVIIFVLLVWALSLSTNALEYINDKLHPKHG